MPQILDLKQVATTARFTRLHGPLRLTGHNAFGAPAIIYEHLFSFSMVPFMWGYVVAPNSRVEIRLRLFKGDEHIQ